MDFVGKVTTEGSADFVPADQRIATFDNDGTLWAEQPMYFQFLFALDPVKAMAPHHSEWKEKEPFASLLKGDVKGALAGGEKPMLELLGYPRANGFKTFIVSGGGVEFMRAFAEKTYGIPPEQVIGSSGKTKFEMRDGKPVLIKLPEVNFIDDKEGKPVAINKFIGRRPILAFGNSDGDLQMLQITAAGSGVRLMG